MEDISGHHLIGHLVYPDTDFDSINAEATPEERTVLRKLNFV